MKKACKTCRWWKKKWDTIGECLNSEVLEKNAHLCAYGFLTREDAVCKHWEPEQRLSRKNIRKIVTGALNLIKEKEIITGLGREFNEWKDDFLERVEKAFEGEKASIITTTLKILPIVLERAFESANVGHSKFVASVRYIAEKAEVSTFTAGRCLGFLIALGILERKEKKSLESGTTYMLSINKNISTNEIRSKWLKMKEIGILSLKSFNQHNEYLAVVLGEKFDEVFTRKK